MSWGTELNGALWTMDGKEFSKNSSYFKSATAVSPGATESGKVTQGKLSGAVSVFVEGTARLCLGASIGYGAMPAVSSKIRYLNATFYFNQDLDNKITYIPMDVYLKHTSISGKLALFGGGGVNYVMASTDFKREASPGDQWKGTFTQNKIIPHLQAGGELFLSKRISLSFGVKYLFSGVLDKLTGKVEGDKSRMIMISNPSYGEAFSYKSTSSPLASDERPFKYDLSGLRVNFGLRTYF